MDNTNEYQLALICIELTTGLKYKSKQSLRYLEKAKQLIKKYNDANNIKD